MLYRHAVFRPIRPQNKAFAISRVGRITLTATALLTALAHDTRTRRQSARYAARSVTLARKLLPKATSRATSGSMRMCGSRLGRGARAAFVTALLLPYLLLQSIATGVMPVLVDDRLSFVICTGDDLVKATLLPDGSYDFEPDETDPHAKADTCPWAIAHAPADLAASPDIPAPTLQSHALSPLLAPSPVPFGSSTRTPPARAPPLRS